MSDSFNIVKDSSIWYNPVNYSAHTEKNPQIRIGIVQKVFVDQKKGDIRYLVEVQDRNDRIPTNCRMMRRFGGVYNYEDVIYRGYAINDKPDPVQDFQAKAGDIVLVASLNGETREGVILGGITHAARRVELKPEDGPQYKSEFNGVEKYINKDGEYTVTFKGQPTNLDKLKETPSAKIKSPTYNVEIGSTYYKFDKEGGWQICDNAKSDPQKIHVDKKTGTVTINSGKVSLKFTKKTEDIAFKSKTLGVTATDKIEQTTKTFKVAAETTATIKSPKIALGTDSIELLDMIVKLIDAMSKVQPISPLGPCTPLIATPQWPDIETIKSKITEIKGSIS